MLERTLSSDFVPGSNLRGDVSGANWLFALPNLRPGTVLCLGMPSPAAIQALVRRTGRLLICPPAGAMPGPCPPQAHLLICRADEALPLADGCADLIVITGRSMARRVARKATLQAEVRRVLAPGGLVYVEGWGAPPALTGLRTVGRLWLTPLLGEVHTAVPADDRLTRRFFVQRRLFTPTFSLRALKRIGRHAQQRHLSRAVESEGHDSASVRRGLKRRLRRPFGWIEQLPGNLERVWYQRANGRRAVLFSADARVDLANPPAYLRALATEAGLPLDGYRWGLWAGGQYSSRKVLFYLFEGVQATPRYLVKLVRDVAFNPRLENEARALCQLHALGFGKQHLLPQVAFSGCAGDLSVVGETLVEGAPFLSRTALSPTCPLAQAAVAWLTDLGTETVTWQPAQAVASALEQLFERFQALYHLPDAERDFLAGQIARLGETEQPFPLVFQHGDPGPWNMLVAPDGRIALLDWESAETQGMPLWDLFYFLRSYALNVSRTQGISNRLAGVTRHFLAESPLSAWIVETVHHYCAQVGVGSQYVEPLYYACWMHRALKQATLLSPQRLAQGAYLQLLRRSIAEPDAPTLRRLFTGARNLCAQ